MHRAGLQTANKQEEGAGCATCLGLRQFRCGARLHTEALFFDVYVVLNFRDADNNHLSGFPASASTACSHLLV